MIDSDFYRGVLDTTIHDLLKIFGFLRVLQFSPPIKVIYVTHNIHRITSDMKVMAAITESFKTDVIVVISNLGVMTL